MKDVLLAILLTALSTILWINAPTPDGKVYDCSLAEIHPDYPPEVKAGCRKWRKHNRDQETTKYST